MNRPRSLSVRHIVPCAVALALCAVPDGQELGERADWRALRLDLEVTPVPDAGVLGLEGVLRLRLEAERSDTIVLALNGKEALGEFRDVTADPGGAVELNERSPRRAHVRLARVTLDEPLRRGAEVELVFVCEITREWEQLQIDPEACFASWVEGWYPFLPDRSKSFSAMVSTAGTTTFHLPPGWDVVSNGSLAERRTGEEGVSVVWKLDRPVARSFAAGPYRAVRHEVGQREVGVYLLPGTTLDVRRQAELLGAALAAQEERFGPYPYPTYAIAEVPEGRGFYASSEQGFIMARSSAFAWEHGNLPLWGHEMAHGWWGNLIGTEGRGGILCSESLAQYSAVVAIEAVEGRAAATEFLRFSRSGYPSVQCARGYFQMIRDGTDRPLSELTGGGWEHNLSDAKGHWVFHMLRRRLGDERFFAGLRGLIASYAGKEVRLADLRAHFVRAAPPEARIERFFEQWLDREGAPVLEVEWESRGDGEVEVRIRQVHEGRPYDLDVPVSVAGANGATRHTVRIERREERFVLRGDGEVAGVELDPEHELLIWHPDYGEAP